MTTHDLKCWPEHFEPVARGAKTCELRLNDRNYQVGDDLLLREYEPMAHAYTGRELRVRVTHILSGGAWLAPGYIAMSISRDPDPLRAAAQAVVESAARELNYTPDVLLVSTAALDALRRAMEPQKG